MHAITWRNGLLSATNEERRVLLELEHRARSAAIQEWYLERLQETGCCIADAHDLDVRGASTKWGRKAGCLYCCILVYGRSAGRIRTFHWRASLRSRARR